MNEAVLPEPVKALTPKYYTDPEIYARSRDRIFCKTWQYACHQSAIPRHGDYVAFSVMDERIFVARQKDGSIRGFYNVCQHRGHSLVEDRGRARVIVCPYHAWAYELDGKLRGAPGSGEAPGFDKSKICLTGVRVEEFCGFVFVNLDPDAAPMSEMFPGVADAIRAACPDIEDRVFADDRYLDEACNWLVSVENYNECYHCQHVHATFSAGIVDPASYNISAAFEGAKCLNHRAGAQRGDGAWYDTSGGDYASFFLWPGFSLQIYPSQVVNTYHWRPMGLDKVRVYRNWFSADGAVDDDLQKVIELDFETTFSEDVKLVESVQRGLKSRGYVPGPLVLNPNEGIQSEHSIASLHSWMREAVDD